MKWIIGFVTFSISSTIVECCQNETITTCPQQNLTCAKTICSCSTVGQRGGPYYMHINCVNVLQDIPADIPKGTLTITLRENNITTVKSGAFTSLNSVEKLDLENNNITYIESKAFNDLPKLESINLQNNKITCMESEAFHNLPSLLDLIMYNNLLTDIEENTFCNLPSLVNLILTKNLITMIRRNSFCNLPSILNLVLHQNRISLIERDAFLNVKADPLLRDRNPLLEDEVIKNVIEVIFGNSSLKTLSLSQCLELKKISSWKKIFTTTFQLYEYLNCNCSFMWFFLWIKEHPLSKVDGFCTNVNKTVSDLVTDNFKLCYENIVTPMKCNRSHSIEITCTSRYLTSYFKHWVHTRNGTEIRKLTGKPIDDANVLSIAFCNYEDVGEYTCIRTTNYLALAEVSLVTMKLSVHGPPILLDQHSVEVQNDLVLSFVFYCDPYSEPEWLLGDTVLSKGSKYMLSTRPYPVSLNQQLTRTYDGFITNLTIFNYKQFPSTTYTCRINNGFGEIKETMISRSVNIEMPRTITRETSTTAEVNCSLDFSGAIPDSWIHSSGGQIIRYLSGTVINNTNILIIPFCNYQDIGDYLCTWRTNVPGLIFNKTTTLIVNGPPLLLQQLISKDGNDTVLSVFFFSHPFPVEPKWYFHENTVSLSYDYQQTTTYSNVTLRQHRRDIIRQGFVSNLTLVRSKSELHGDYICKIVNGFGYLQLDFKVTEAHAEPNSPSNVSTTVIVSTSTSVIVVLIIIVVLVVCKCRKRKKVPDGYTGSPIPQSSVPAVYDSIRLSRIHEPSEVYLDVY